MQNGRQLSLNIVPPAPTKPALPPPPPYVVSLRDTEMTQTERMKVEARFCKVLEERLGPPEQVAAMLAQLQDAEFRECPLSPQEREMGIRWQRAYGAARLAALQDLAAITGAWFEVCVFHAIAGTVPRRWRAAFHVIAGSSPDDHGQRSI